MADGSPPARVYAVGIGSAPFLPRLHRLFKRRERGQLLSHHSELRLSLHNHVCSPISIVHPVRTNRDDATRVRESGVLRLSEIVVKKYLSSSKALGAGVGASGNRVAMKFVARSALKRLVCRNRRLIKDDPTALPTPAFGATQARDINNDRVLTNGDDHA